MKTFEVFVHCEYEGAYTVKAKDAAGAKRKVQRAIDNDDAFDLGWRISDQGSETLTGEIIEL
jgi:hypothetical protein